MDAIKFLEEYRRMCDSFKNCSDCSLLTEDCDNFKNPEFVEKAVPVVEEWSDSHPRKTRQSVFLAQWPNAKVFVDGVLDFCPQELDQCYPCRSTDVEMHCQSCRREFWSQEVE